jgi:hypothetical protein
VQRGGHEGRLKSLVGQGREVGGVTDAAADHELGLGKRAAQLAGRAELGPFATADPCEVEHDEAANARLPGQRDERADAQLRDLRASAEEPAVAQIEAEDAGRTAPAQALHDRAQLARIP